MKGEVDKAALTHNHVWFGDCGGTSVTRGRAGGSRVEDAEIFSRTRQD